MELKLCNAFLFLAIAIAYSSAQRSHYHPQYYQQQQQQQQFSRRRSEPVITRSRVESGDVLSNVGWTAAGLALIGSAATLIAANADSIREQLAAVSSRQLQRQQLPDMEDIFGTSVESCWQLAICDAHARYDEHYKVVALPLTMYYQGSR